MFRNQHMNMELNYILHLGFVCLYNLMQLISIDGKPLIKPELDRGDAKGGQKIALPQDRFADKMQSEKFTQQIFADLKKSATVSNSKVQLAISKDNSPHRLQPRAAEDRKNDDRVIELTIPVSQFKRDQNGQMGDNQWGVIFGKVGQNRRLNKQRVNSENIPEESVTVRDYYPYTGTLETVCMSRSTVYNIPQIKKWLHHQMYSKAHRNIVLLKDLRRSLYKNGNSEECHTVFYSKFGKYQECAMRRNQRLESLIPKYARHQIPSE
ncbi:uncharacterized protein LOC116805441 [Drosophila grimshawi]|uniref:uncharacterized protein LOC116805441 n=1 Tax=Drosophila grimshawi TaxID=7222 RepID=UPI000C871269|nr:uncharacterized protein LOC116805441 [Drosophila grimshawi]